MCRLVGKRSPFFTTDIEKRGTRFRIEAEPNPITSLPELPAMTAEELKECVRNYADENLPGWACAGVSFRIGDIGASITETLVVSNSDPISGPSTSTTLEP